MGFFSWLTNDTGVSISNAHSSQGVRHIVMLDNKGNKWVEAGYSGYGVFGGKDFYELVAEMNDVEPIEGRELRSQGIDLAFSGKRDVIYPNLIEDENSEHWEWEDEKPLDCPYQGYFY